MRIPLAHLRTAAKRRPPGYYDDVTSRGTVSGDDLEISDDAYWEMVRKYNPPTPSLTALATNFAGAVAAWFSAGFPTVSEAEYNARAEKCRNCESIVESRVAWRCAKCGCLGVKLWLATETCPNKPPKWCPAAKQLDTEKT